MDQQLASPVAIKHEMKKVLDIMDVEILDSRSLPASFFASNEVFRKSRDLPKPDGLQLEEVKDERPVKKLTFDTGILTELSTRIGSAPHE